MIAEVRRLKRNGSVMKEAGDEIQKLRGEVRDELKKAVHNKNYAYMRNYKYFKDRVLMPVNL